MTPIRRTVRTIVRMGYRSAYKLRMKRQKMSETERTFIHQQKIALSSIGLFGLGQVVSPWFNLFGIPGLIYNYVFLFKKKRAIYHKNKKLIVPFFELTTILLVGLFGSLLLVSIVLLLTMSAHRLVAKTEREAQADFSGIFGELASTVWILKDGVEVEIPLSALQTHATIVVHGGEVIPVDGQVITGTGLVDQHLLTGEAQPVEKQLGDSVFTSTLLISGTLHIKVEKQGKETITGQIAQTLEHAADFKLQIQSRGDKIVEQGALRTLLLEIITLPFIGPSHAAALGYSGFGYQMRMAAPLMVLNYLRIASRQEILIKDGRALEGLQQIDTIIFDKTGTLTEAVPQVSAIVACAGFTKTQVLHYAASAEQRQPHPIGQAICQYAQHQQQVLLPILQVDYSLGHGLHVTLQDASQSNPEQKIVLGSERFMQTLGVHLPADIQERQQQAGEQGHSVIYLATADQRLMGILELRPTLRQQAQTTIQALRAQGITTYIISGDQENPTRHLANKIGVDHYFSEVLPNDKARHVAELQSAGHKVCFIGDGINDSVALQKADVSISLHGAATIAQDTADIILLTPDLSHLSYLFNLAQDLDRRIRRSVLLNNGFGISCVSGVLLLGLGLNGAIILYIGGVMTSICNAMLPVWTYQQPLSKYKGLL